MICKKIVFDETQPDVFLKTYIIDNFSQFQKDKKRPAVIICPGGAYLYLSERETEFIALSFAARGYHAFVLYYSVFEKAIMPRPIIELAKAVALVRDNAHEWFVDENKIIVNGFSAGGHLASSLMTMWHKEFLSKELDRPNEDFKPNAGILGYPLIRLGKKMIDSRNFFTFNELKSQITNSSKGKKIKEIISEVDDLVVEIEEIRKIVESQLSFIDFKDIFYIKNAQIWVKTQVLTNLLLGKSNFTDEEANAYSTNKLVNENTPPAFVYTTFTDKLVSRSDSIAFVNAMAMKNIPVEFHMFSDGVHGLSLGTNVTSANKEIHIHHEVSMWFELAIGWLERIF